MKYWPKLFSNIFADSAQSTPGKPMRAWLSFLIGVILTAIAAYVACSMKTSYIKARFISEVDAPVYFSLDNIVKTFDNNNPALAEAKIRLLHSRWKNYHYSDEPLGDIHLDVGEVTLPKSHKQ